MSTTKNSQTARAENWIENVNIILIKPETGTEKDQNNPNSLAPFDYQVCTLTVGPENYLVKGLKCRQQFPSGPLEKADFSPEWIQIFSENEIEQFYNKSNQIERRPPIVSNNLMLKRLKCENDDGKYLDVSIALRVCAARCIFQQTGILLCKVSSPLETPLSDWQTMVQQNPENFLKLFQKNPIQIIPTFLNETLYEWWNWMTPTTVSPRYDTMFYICIVDNNRSNWNESTNVVGTMLQTNHLNQTSSWNRIDQIFANYERLVIEYDYLLSPAQLYELARLAAHRQFRELCQFVATRERYGVDRWVPLISSYKDGCIAFLPGDDYYPSIVEYGQPKCPPRMYDQIRVEEMRNRKQNSLEHPDSQQQQQQQQQHYYYCHVNRIELRGYQCRIVISEPIIIPEKSDTSKMGQSCGHYPINRTILPVIEVGCRHQSKTDTQTESSSTSSTFQRLQFNFNFFTSKL